MQLNPTPGLLIKDRYKLIQNIGQGSFGEVWLADDPVEKKYVALKIYQWLDRDGVNTFSKEMETTKDLRHPNLLIPNEFDDWNQRPFLVMEYCGKGSVSRLAGTLSEEMAWKFIHDVASGLAYLHGLYEPIVHQDVKPYNIVIGDDNTYKITDFGISTKVRDHLARHSGHRNPNAGALAYMAPERFTPDSLPLTASDIWAFGVTIFELLSGRLPFSGMGGGMLKGGAEIPNIPPNYSEQLDRLVTACLQKNTWDRPTARDIENYASAVLRGEVPPEPWGKPVKVPQPNLISREMKEDILKMEKDTVAAQPDTTRWKAMAAAVAGILVVGALIFVCINYALDSGEDAGAVTLQTDAADQNRMNEASNLAVNERNVNDIVDDRIAGYRDDGADITGEDGAARQSDDVGTLGNTEVSRMNEYANTQTPVTRQRQPAPVATATTTAGSGYMVNGGDGYTGPEDTGRPQNKVDSRDFRGKDRNGYVSRAASANPAVNRYKNDARVKNMKEVEAMMNKANSNVTPKAVKVVRKETPMDNNVAEAVRKGDYAAVKKYADEGNVSAYLPMADLCMHRGEYANAKMYANKAIAAGNASATRVISLLKKMDYED